MKVTFIPQNISVEVTSDKSLLQIANENKIEIKSICKGVPSCAECRVHIKSGENNILPPTKAEVSLIGSSYYIDGRRLSCQVHCFGDVTVDLTEQIERAEIQSKKVRGFKSQKQVESHAVQDTLILAEKDVEKPTEKPSDKQADKASERAFESKNQISQNRSPQHQNQNQNRNQHQNQHQNQNQHQKHRSQQQGSQKKQNDQGRDKNRKN